MLRRISKLMLLLFSLGLCQGQYASLSLFHNGEKFYFIKVVEKGETLYRIAKQYQTEIDQILNINETPCQQSIQLGDTLLLPFNRSRYNTTIIADKPYKEIYYGVSQGDNLFRLSRVMLGVHEGVIMSLNLLDNTDIKIGQQLLMGYYSIEEYSALEPLHPSIDDVMIHTSSNDIAPLKVKNYISQNGPVLWFEDESFGEELFVMHLYAKPGSDIFIYNPMLKRRIKARVIGNIPPNTYPKEILALLSPAAAKALGALDTKFYVRIKYEE
jgi:LysM repeat protein